MLQFVIQEQKKGRNILLVALLFIGLFSLYVYLDNYGFQSYIILGDAFGQAVVIQTIVLNVLISLISAITISLTVINYQMNTAMPGGSIFASIGNIFAVIFTGCATCGLTFFGAFGLGLALPVVTPGAIKYKFFALLVIILGFIIVLYIIQTSTCSLKKRR